jgi:transcriptional regulator NrdR family protein
MLCPFCKSDRNQVIDTRKFDTVIIRIRLCKDCHFGWHTQETPGIDSPQKIVRFKTISTNPT